MLTKEQIKHTGSTFTPEGLANYLADKILRYSKSRNVRVLDPACGDGELLVAIGKKLLADNRQFSLTGFDSNRDHLTSANERLATLADDKVNLVSGDFLAAIDLPFDQTTLDLFAQKPSSINNSFDVIIANPPYVRTQILGSDQAQDLAQKFQLKGRVDLYYPFLMAMTESLKQDGILGVITSNRYLSTKSGDSIRKYLSENFEILEVIDLGDTKLFTAAVLPAIFIGRKRKSKEEQAARFIKVYEELTGSAVESTGVRSIYEILENERSGYFSIGSKRYKKTVGILKHRTTTNKPWELLSGTESEWVSEIDSRSETSIGALFKVRVGIKTTADKVYISDSWDSLGADKPEEELLKPLISQENISPWNAQQNLSLKVLYPHISENGNKRTIELDKYPKAKQYFLTHEQQLRSRKYLIEAGRKWFEIWVPHRPEHWNLPKLVFPDISVTPRFYFDTGGKIVNGNCYWIVAESSGEIDKLLLIQGVANSKLMTKYHDLVFNNKLYSGRRRYLTQYVERYPLPAMNSTFATEIVSLAKELNKSEDNERTAELEQELEVSVAKAFGVSPVFSLD